MVERRQRAEKRAERFGQRLKKIRAARGLTQIELQRMTGISNDQIGDYERGRMLPGLLNMLLLADALKVDLNWFVKGVAE